MTEEAGLLAAILADPDDDTPRLVYADWLEEYGDEPARAEFIRAGCQAARLPPGDRRAEKLLARCRQLQAQHDEAWTGPLRAACANEFSFTYSRGFAYKARADGLRPARGFAAVAARAPITSLQLDESFHRVTRGEIEDLARRPELARLREVECRLLPPDRIAALLASPHLTVVEVLRVLARNINGAARVVAESGLATRLRLLELWCGNNQQLSQAQGLGQMLRQSWPALTHLRVEACMLSNDELQALVSLFRAPQLRMLHVGRNALDPPSLAALLERSLGPSALSFTDIGPAPTDDWVDAPPGRAKLRLSGFRNGRALLPALLQSQPRPLDALELVGDEFTAEDARALAGWPGLAGVKEVSLVANPLGDEGAAALAASPHLDAVEMLRMLETGMSKAGKAAIKKRFGRRVRVT